MKVWIAILEVLITALCASLTWVIIEMPIALSGSVSLILLVAIGWSFFSLLMSMFWRDV